MKHMTEQKAESLNCYLICIAMHIHNINYGGCGIFAELLFRILVLKGYRCKLVCLDAFALRTPQDHKINLTWIRAREDNSIFLYNHICVLVGQYYFDCTNYERKAKSGVFQNAYDKVGELSVRQLQYLNSLDHKWNSTYDRRQNRALKILLTHALTGF